MTDEVVLCIVNRLGEDDLTASRTTIIENAIEKMRRDGANRPAVATFRHHLEFLLAGRSAVLTEEEILPVQVLPALTELARYSRRGQQLLGRTVVIKLNGGMGTSMGLDGPKSLIEVRDAHCFLDLIARQVLELRRLTETEIPLLLMNSAVTRQPSLARLEAYPELKVPGLPLDFLQNRVPKIECETFQPVEYPQRPDLEWCPPGHGDLYTALGTSGALRCLMERGIEYAFVSNADNLGAVLIPEILGFMADQHCCFLMEVADRTPADRKGGHLCLIRGSGLGLRESAQCPPSQREAFQDIERYRFFNTNNLWIHLPSIAGIGDRFGGIFPLPTIVNEKPVDPRNPDSPRVFQLETAMGSAISIFPEAMAVRVPRERFSPVKTTSDLLAVRSDAYRLTDDSRIVTAPELETPPSITLDPRFYSMLPEFERRFPFGPPSLIACTSLEVAGDVTFEKNIRFAGDVRVVSAVPSRLHGDAGYTGTVQPDDTD